MIRSVTPEYASAKDFITGAGAQMNGARWNAIGTFRAVYGSMTSTLAMQESLAKFHRFGIPEAKAMPRLFRAISVRLSCVLDLTEGSVRQALRVSRKRMVDDAWWKAQGEGKESLTQAIGRAAYEAGLEGIVVPSAADKDGKNIVVFPDNLRGGSKLEVQ